MSTILILAASLHVAARSTAQRVTYSGKDVELPAVLSVIREQTGYVFFYDKKDLKDIAPISVSLKDVPVEDALKSILLGLPLEFELQGNTVFITRKAVPRLIESSSSEPEAAPVDTIRGYVHDSTGAPLQGASITIKGTTEGTKTDLRGSFGLIHAKAGMVVVISYTGYTNSEIVISSTTHPTLFVTLRRSQSALDATIVQAYGTTSRRFNIGSISTVDAATIEAQPVSNVLLALQGQAPGLAITTTNGAPGAQVLVQVRGQNTLASNPSAFGAAGYKPYNQPLFIIDGVPFAPQNNNLNQLETLASNSNYTGGINVSGGISPFASINPDDIESVSILKDADATSIYGTQGSNGVILITTKKGKPGKTTFNLKATTGSNSAEHYVKLMNTPQYLQMRAQAFANDGVTPSNNPYSYPAYAPDLTIFDSTKYTDWEKIIYGKVTNNTDIHGTLSGGSYNNTFLVSGGFTRSDYMYPGSFADQRLTLHSNFHHVSQDNRLSVDFGTDYGYDHNNSPGGGVASILLPPNTPNLLDPQGNLIWSYKGVSLGNFQTLYPQLKQPDLVQTYNLNTSLRVAYKIMTGLAFTVDAGYNRNTTGERQSTPSTAQDPLYINRQAMFANNTFETVNVEPQIDYSTAIGNGLLTALAGASYKKNTNYSNQIQGSGYANDNFLGSINGAASVYVQDASNLYKYDAFFARLKYVYDKKYILSFTGRRDGSSNFGPGRQFGDFGSVGAGWIFSEEKAFKNLLPFISYAKLSGSYGTSGSDGVAAYQYQAFYSPITYVNNFQGSQPDAPINFYNPNYSWATKRSLNTSLDLGLFHDRVLLNATWYRDREGNQLGGYPIPIQSGFGQVLENVPGTVQNAGWEFTLSSNQIKTKTFSWTTNFNITFNRNKLLSFPDLAGSPYANYYVLGKPTSEIMGYRFKGLNPQTGLFEYYTTKGQTTNSPNYELEAQGGDKVPIGDQEVRFMGGFGNTVTYKRISLYVFFQFSSQEAPNYLQSVYSSYNPGTSANNEPVEVLNYWKNPGDQTTIQKLVSKYGSVAYTAAESFSSSSGAYGTDTYARLKTMVLSWSLPEAFCKKAHIQNAKIYLSGQNLFTITSWKVADPEQFANYTAFPMQRTVACGLNFNF
ncbi:MAG TPA: SusC/RagA family TonB-linked outer membrane protein [Puia sp.]|nr:SusC/RagA family TonB-linked outer membrane protein [Puia sp.]